MQPRFRNCLILAVTIPQTDHPSFASLASLLGGYCTALDLRHTWLASSPLPDFNSYAGKLVTLKTVNQANLSAVYASDGLLVRLAQLQACFLLHCTVFDEETRLFRGYMAHGIHKGGRYSDRAWSHAEPFRPSYLLPARMIELTHPSEDARSFLCSSLSPELPEHQLAVTVASQIALNVPASLPQPAFHGGVKAMELNIGNARGLPMELVEKLAPHYCSVETNDDGSLALYSADVSIDQVVQLAVTSAAAGLSGHVALSFPCPFGAMDVVAWLWHFEKGEVLPPKAALRPRGATCSTVLLTPMEICQDTAFAIEVHLEPRLKSA